MKVRDFLTNT
ncbi:hypothetical protein YPPY96_3571, partial [Yersinia pestis PY-96]